jgi:EcsC protein family
MKLTAAELSDLDRAVSFLEQPRLAIRLANYAGKPLDGALNAIPKLSGALHSALRKAILQCLTVAIESQEEEAFEPSAWLPKTLTGLTGAVGGLFGAVSLPLELPLTTTLMMRAIADIARHQGEDLSLLEPRLACLQVLALGHRKADASAVIGYYAARSTLNRLTAELVAGLVERTVLDASAPVVTRMVAEIVSRFGLVWSERFAAGAIPVLGALGAASLNMVFMDHFERVAQGHFIVRRLEREYGRELIGELYRYAASGAKQRSVSAGNS